MMREKTGAAPPVIDSRDVLEDPRGVLGRLCAALGLEFSESMLSWEAGPRETDGVWAKHWYAAVEKSTGFHPYRPKRDELSNELAPVLDECRHYYDHLYAHRIAA